MEHEGMVHALRETRRLLKTTGVLINILPVPEGYFIEVHHDGRILFSERKRETCSEDVLRAEAAISREYWEEQNAYEVEPKAKDALAREEHLYAQAKKILMEVGEGVEVVIRERVRIERLRPLK
jgi:hypothetical protein